MDDQAIYAARMGGQDNPEPPAPHDDRADTALLLAAVAICGCIAALLMYAAMVWGIPLLCALIAWAGGML